MLKTDMLKAKRWSKLTRLKSLFHHTTELDTDGNPSRSHKADVPDPTINFSGQGIQQLGGTINVGGDLNIASQHFTGASKSARDQERRLFLQQLCKSPYEDRKNRNPTRAEGTCEWFTDHHRFQNWQAENSALLWVSADPGCGKSVLSRYLVDDIVPSDCAVATDPSGPPESFRTTCYFFFKDDFEDQKTLEGAISCLLHQLFTQKPAFLTDKILDDFAEQGSQLFSSFHKLWEMLLAAARSDVKGQIVCILDALDECVDQSQLGIALTNLYSNGIGVSGLKFLVTSRPYLRIHQNFQELKKSQPTIHLSGDSPEEVNKIEREIGIVIEQRTDEICKKLHLSYSEKEALETQLASTRHRTYLWVHLVFASLERAVRLSKNTILHSIREMPRTVEEAYDKILQKSDHPQHARKILHVVVAADRPLHLDEMAVALALEPQHEWHQDVTRDCLAADDLSVQVREACGLFVVIQDSRVFLLHQTAREFLVQLPTSPLECRNPSLKWQHSFLPEQSHRIMTAICVQYLLLQEFNKPRRLLGKVLTNMPLLKYAASNWATHYNQTSETTNTYLEQSVHRLCLAETQTCRTWLEVYGKDKRNEDQFHEELTTSLLIATYFDFEDLVRLGLQDNSTDKVTRAGNSRRTALSWACENGNQTIVKLLLEDEPSRSILVDQADKNRRTPLWYATVNGYYEIAKLLLEKGAKLKTGDENGQTPLMQAVRSNRKDMIQLFLENGGSHNASVLEAKNMWGRTPLITAASSGNEAVALILLDHGADVDAVDESGKTALIWASGEGRLDIANHLLDRGAQVDIADVDGSTALTEASSNGDPDIVQSLLEKGASIDASDRYGLTALMRAAKDGYLEVIQVLLKKGAFVHASDRWGGTALTHACERGQDDCVQLLIDSGAEVDVSPKVGMEALSFATLNRQKELVQLLLDQGADVNSVDGAGHTALILAAGIGEREIVELLLNRGAHSSVLDQAGMTALVYASVAGHKDTVQLLVERGADVDEYTILLAADRGHRDVAQLLRDHVASR